MTKITTQVDEKSNSRNHPPQLDKNRQKKLQKWLKDNAQLAKKEIRQNALIGWLMSLCMVTQAGMLAWLLHAIIIDKTHPKALLIQLLVLFGIFVVRSGLLLARERTSQRIGQTIRKEIRQRLLAQLTRLGPSAFQSRSAGTWSTIIIEQVDNLHDYYAKYLPQMQLVMVAPVTMLIAVFWFNWAAGLILLLTAPLIPIFMALVGMGAADANRRNFMALAHLSGYFLDRLKGLDTLRLFDQKATELTKITQTSQDFRVKTMEVLRLAFLSSAVLEFFTSVSIALMAVYFGFSFLGDLNFGHYGIPISLFIGFFCLILAPEFYQPLRDLGIFYHAKAQAVAAADTLTSCIDMQTTSDLVEDIQMRESLSIDFSNWQVIRVHELRAKSFDGIYLTEPLNFILQRGSKVALVGESGAGKSTVMQVLLGFLPYEGEIYIDDVLLSVDSLSAWRNQIHWLGQHPVLPADSIKQNLVLTTQEPLQDENIWQALTKAKASEFVAKLPEKENTLIGEHALRLSVGQAQRIALAKLFVIQRSIWFLDEPTASLDSYHATLVMDAIYEEIGLMDSNALNDGDADSKSDKLINKKETTLLFITHNLAEAEKMDVIWRMEQGSISVQSR